MQKLEQTVGIEEKVIFSGIVKILNEMTRDWDKDLSGEISPDSRLVRDLGFESIDFVMFIVAIEGHFKRQGLPFEKLLMRDGQYVTDVRVCEVVEFVRETTYN